MNLESLKLARGLGTDSPGARQSQDSPQANNRGGAKASSIFAMGKAERSREAVKKLASVLGGYDPTGSQDPAPIIIGQAGSPTKPADRARARRSSIT